MTTTDEAREIRRAQEHAHGAGHDYEAGSPHLKHPALHGWMVGQLHAVVGQLHTGRRPEVLEVGAGHGTFTGQLVEAGARVTVTEMSLPSAERLRARFATDGRVRVVHDPAGDHVPPAPVDAVLCLSVLHHIPDYLGAVRRLVEGVRPGGAFVAFQDPPWYPRMTRTARALNTLAYYAWRLGQGEVRRGLATIGRRVRGAYDPSEPSDMSEYHVVRSGLDELALRDLLEQYFTTVEVVEYWSTQARWLQVVGARFFPPNTFGVVARGRRAT